jgi:hypothetical protein
MGLVLKRLINFVGNIFPNGILIGDTRLYDMVEAQFVSAKPFRCIQVFFQLIGIGLLFVPQSAVYSKA